MREIIFKAKRKHSPHEWITGDLNHIDGNVFIFPRTEDAPLNSPDWFEVNISTVCQYTEVNDYIGNKIFDCDRLSFKLQVADLTGFNYVNPITYFIKHENGAFYIFCEQYKDADGTPLRWGHLGRILDADVKKGLPHIQVIGNIHD